MFKCKKIIGEHHVQYGTNI